jgi:MOSC domain
VLTGLVEAHIVGHAAHLLEWDTSSTPRGGVVARLLSVNVGKPKNVQWRDKTVYTGICKTPVDGAVMVRRLNIDGDGQGDLGGHGGEQRAVMVYQTESYDFWKTYLNRDDLVPGNFGENFTVTGLADDDVCIGDRYRIGDAEFEVTQPRVTCFRVGLRLNQPAMPNLLVSQHRPGFYFEPNLRGEFSDTPSSPARRYLFLRAEGDRGLGGVAQERQRLLQV